MKPTDEILKEFIVCACIKARGMRFLGKDHHTCLVAILKKFPDFTPKSESKYLALQGFVTNLDRFVSRHEGAKIAYEAGQIKEVKELLYSEDYRYASDKELHQIEIGFQQALEAKDKEKNTLGKIPYDAVLVLHDTADTYDLWFYEKGKETSRKGGVLQYDLLKFMKPFFNRNLESLKQKEGEK